MKAVLISIQAKWCNLIASGKKTVEVRKSKPKIDVPFKCYIYCTKKEKDVFFTEEVFDGQKGGYAIPHVGNGKIVGEFVCNRIDDFYCCSVPYRERNNLGYGAFIDNGVYQVRGWHEGVVFERNDRYIDSMLKNSDLKKMCLSVQEIFDYIGIGKHLYGWHISNLVIYDKPKELGEFEGLRKTKFGYEPIKMTRSPQSWCYVEELM